MSTASATAFLLWAILSVLFLAFLVHHLWCYDKFKCLRWSAGRQPGAFKRVMTYSYLGAVPLFAVYSIGTTVIKYREGFVILPDGTFIPRPIEMYQEVNREWVLPLQFVFSFAWALELVTHLEELAFWLYLLHQNPNKEAWFSSWEYRLWYMGSLLALIGMPLTALITRNHLETCDAYIFLVGAAGSTSTTLSFLYVLWRFPKFIRHVKEEGADPTVVVRLATFYQLNQVRVVFRFMFTLPLLVLALDGIIGVSHPVNRNLFLTDFFTMIAGLGCFVSSMITLLIFFPRSIVREAGYKPKLASASTLPPTSPTSPKSPPASPPRHGHPGLQYHLPGYGVRGAVRAAGAETGTGVSGGVTGTGTGYTGTGYTGYTATGYTGTGYTWERDESAYTASMCSPRESLYDSPQYTAEDYSASAAVGGVGGGDTVQRRPSRVSRRGSRRVSAYNPMDAHLEQDTDADDEEEEEMEMERGRGRGGAGSPDVDGERDADVERAGYGEGEGVTDEESVPPYSHAHPHPHPHLPPHAHANHQHLHQRHPFPHSLSSPQVLTLAQHAAPPRSPPAAPHPHPHPQHPQAYTNAPINANTNGAPAPARSPSPSSTSKSKRRTWGWEESRHAQFALSPNVMPGTGLSAHTHINANANGGGHGGGHGNVNAEGARRSLHAPVDAGGVGLGMNVNLGSVVGRTARRGSSLHPYVVNFTSPIDLVDIPPMDDLPRAI
ncbi:hypothetical protein OH77DRAFT_1061049 [Trametes cingulata]|nr:hypothetical protein OH77DRAFT_1061049 [Trametes cingulata]